MFASLQMEGFFEKEDEKNTCLFCCMIVKKTLGSGLKKTVHVVPAMEKFLIGAPVTGTLTSS